MNMKRLITCALAGLLAAACSVEKRVGKAQDDVMQQYRALPDAATLPQRIISWPMAVELMLKHNLEYAQAQLALADARRQENAVFRRMIPGVNVGYYYNQALFRNNNAYGRSGGGDLSINVLFSLPDLLNLPAEKYTAALAVFKAEQDCELKRRELVAKLYLHFLEDARLARSRSAEDAARADEPAARHTKRESRRLQDAERHSQLCELIGRHDAHWRLATNTLPRVRVQDYLPRVNEPGDLSQIMMALELETSRLRKLGVALRYWPSTQVNFYSPSLFSMSGGNMSGFTEGMKDVRVNLSLYLPVDTRLEAWQEYQHSKEQHALLLRQLEQRMLSWREKMQLVLDSWKQYEEWREAMQCYIDFRRRQGAQDPEGMLQLHAESIKLQQEMLDQEAKNAERIGALIQEYGLPGERRATVAPHGQSK